MTHAHSLPAHDWQGHSNWRIQQTRFDLLAFLNVWQAWRLDTQRPHHLHVVAQLHQGLTAAQVMAGFAKQLEADAPDIHTLQPLAEELAKACWGLLPGLHRLRFEQGQLTLTLCVGEAPVWDEVMRHNPAGPCAEPEDVRRVVVVGSGIAGAGTARALAERGWQVTVLDSGPVPAAGASGLPVGLVAPHTSPDDSLISRLSRAGVRAMRHAMENLLTEGQDWAPTGVQERRLPGKTRKGGAPASWSHELAEAGRVWTCAAQDAPQEALQASAPENALWHTQGAWLRPAQLVQALLTHPSIHWQGNTAVTGLRHVPHSDSISNTSSHHAPEPCWQVLQGEAVIASVSRVVLAAGPATTTLLTSTSPGVAAPPIRPLRGQLSWGLMIDASHAPMPNSPVNGNGSFVHGVPTALGPAWFAGSTFDRVNDRPVLKDDDHAENFIRLSALLPDTAEALAPQFAAVDAKVTAHTAPAVRGWAGVRCSVPDRLPVVGPVAHAPAGLWVNAAMGSRGLTLGLLCGELLAARWHDEPLPVEPPLAKALDAARFSRSA